MKNDLFMAEHKLTALEFVSENPATTRQELCDLWFGGDRTQNNYVAACQRIKKLLAVGLLREKGHCLWATDAGAHVTAAYRAIKAAK